ncbi:MAG: indolepyruvate ferredoxin oxidoreductase family protein [Rhizobiales bacterium]|nr:indolepyruvate ferredoxin oxidoreductase family protein [Hyphomicrobiales bacterium]
MSAPVALDDYKLEDRYERSEGRVFLTGTQALVRIVLDQAKRDQAAGLKTAGFISGYRGSPLGGVDQELWRVRDRLSTNGIEFLPAVNEDLAATAVLGSQQVETNPDRKVQGVFGLWYGKGPGVDRSGDELKHGNAYGSSPHGGVLVVAGDDHGCVSSSMPHQSDVAFMSWMMPVLHPASVSEYLSFGEYGYALSRFSGMWVGFKAISEVVESGRSFAVQLAREFNQPDIAVPPGGLHYRWPDLPGPQIEQRFEFKKQAVFAFAKANPIDRVVYPSDGAFYGIVTAGKAHADAMEALRLLGLTQARCEALGIEIYKVGMVWPLEPSAALSFVKSKKEILVVEEKRGIIESQLKEYFYDQPGSKPNCMVGKYDELGKALVPWIGELSPLARARIIARRLDLFFPELDLPVRVTLLEASAIKPIAVMGGARTPYFCSGCPHNRSTKVPEGSAALAGIGCHFMASWMDRKTGSLIQMGGEGVNWVASSLFTGKGHIFQNLGEGTYYHSGSTAIRQAIAAKTNITYKILFNDAVAMTGGQPVDGPVSIPMIAHGLRAEGVDRIAIVSDKPDAMVKGLLPSGVTIDHRDDLDAVQRELRDIPGVTILIYDQVCATEQRKRRKRGTAPDVPQFGHINARVCEGCGDCSDQSNCLSVEPVETVFGRKRKINQSNCNKDFSCLDGFCPSFIIVEGGKRHKAKAPVFDIIAHAGQLAAPAPHTLDKPFNLLIAGIGGTGVVTIGAILSMAAHLEGLGVSVLDFTGFAQKFGPVLSYMRFSKEPDDLNQVRIDHGSCDALMACDLVVATSEKAFSRYGKHTKAAVSLSEMPTGELIRNRDSSLNSDKRLHAIAGAIGHDHIASIDASALSETFLGDAVFANMILMGVAWQNGLIPLSQDAIARAIELNGASIEQNRRAFSVGRLAAVHSAVLNMPEKINVDPGYTELMKTYTAELKEYQNENYARRFERSVQAVYDAEKVIGQDKLAIAIAKSLFKLMAYKDEYEVARLHTREEFLSELSEQYQGDLKISYYFSAPILTLFQPARQRPAKIKLGPWLRPFLKLLAKLKWLRNTPFDPFGYTAERRSETELVTWFEAIIPRMIAGLTVDNHAKLVTLAALPMQIRGYGFIKHEAIQSTKIAVEKLLGEYSLK